MALPPLSPHKGNSFSAQTNVQEPVMYKIKGIDQELENIGEEIPISLAGLHVLLSDDPTRQDVLNPLIDRLKSACDLLTQKRLVFSPVLTSGEKELAGQILDMLQAMKDQHRNVKDIEQSLRMEAYSNRENVAQKSTSDPSDLPSRLSEAMAEEIPEELKDFVTTKMMIEPMRLPCDHMFSMETVREIECCPLCRGDIDGVEPDEALAKKIRSFLVTKPILGYGLLVEETKAELEIDYRGQAESLAEEVADLSNEIAELQASVAEGESASVWMSDVLDRIPTIDSLSLKMIHILEDEMPKVRGFKREQDRAEEILPVRVHDWHQKSEELAFNQRKMDGRGTLRRKLLEYEKQFSRHEKLQQWERDPKLHQQELKTMLLSLLAECKSAEGLRTLRRRAADLRASRG